MSRFLPVILLLTLTACAQKPVTYDYDPAASQLATGSYALLAPASGPEFQSLDNNRIAATLRSRLGGRNIKEVAREQADFWVAYRVEQVRKLDNSGVRLGIGVGTGNVGVGVGTGSRAKEVLEGRLVVDVIDPRSQQVVWTARANKPLQDGMSPAERDALVNQLVAEMLKNFPPGAGR